MVTRHRAMADGTKRTSRDLGAAPPDQKLARPASEVVREPVHFPARENWEGPNDLFANTEWRRGAFFRLLQSCCGNCWHTSRIVVVTVLPPDSKQSSCLGLAFLTQVHVVTPSGCGCHCATPFFDGFDADLARRRRNNGSFRTVLSSVLVASFSTRRTSSLQSALRSLAVSWRQ